MSLTGKGFYIWKIERCEGGDVQKIAELAKQANLSHIVIKVAGRGQVYHNNEPYLADLIRSLRA